MKKYVFVIIILIWFCNCTNKHENQIRLPGPWFFKIDQGKTGIQQKWFQTKQSLAELKTVEQLGFWESFAGSEYDGWGWYFIDFPYSGKFKKAALSFESVDDNAIVWLNGRKAGEHQGANNAFKIDVTPFIKTGVNRLTVLIEDTGGFGGLTGAIELVPFEATEDLLKGKYFGAETPVHPPLAANAVIYELNTRQFSPEGTFKAIEPRIQELKELGVTIVWFMPIHPIGEKHRKGSLGSYYAVKDYYGINPEFGNLDDFKRLVQLIQEAGMYVIIDLVANHTAWDNPLIEQHPDWYTHDSTGKIITPVADWFDVADLNYDSAELQDYMIDMMKYWVNEVGIDGYRCDVAGMVPTGFWIKVRKELDAIKAMFMLAEAETPELNAFGFDMTYAGAMHRLFNDIAQGKKSPKKIDSYLRFEYYNYPNGSKRMRFTSNHDENSWNNSAITRMGQEAAKAGAVLTCTLPGTPLIYCGQEVGNEKALDFFERDPIEWHENEFRRFYQKLFFTYRRHPALYQGRMEKLVSENDNRIYAFVRKQGDDEVVVIVNFSAEPFEGNINFKSVNGNFFEIFSNEKLNFSGVDKFVKLEAWGYRLYCCLKNE